MPEPLGEARLFLDCDMTAPVSHRLAEGEAVVFSSRSPLKESGNEDAAALLPFDDRCAVLAVADGVGGGSAGARASSITLRNLEKSLARASGSAGSIRAAILDGIERANEDVASLGVGAATTLAAVEVQNGFARPYHVGDSMILMVGQRGRLKLQTVSHSPVGFAVEAGYLDEQEAMHHEDRHLVSNVIGAPDMRIEIGPTIAIARRDTLLLASDGLFDNLHTAEIVERIRKGPLARSARRLADDTLKRMREPESGQPSKPDDLTFVSYRRTA